MSCREFCACSFNDLSRQRSSLDRGSSSSLLLSLRWVTMVSQRVVRLMVPESDLESSVSDGVTTASRDVTSRSDYAFPVTGANRVEKRTRDAVARMSHRAVIKPSAVVFSSTHNRCVYSSNVTEIASPKARSLYPPQDTRRFVRRAPPPPPSASSASRGCGTIYTMPTLLKVNRVIANGSHYVCHGIPSRGERGQPGLI